MPKPKARACLRNRHAACPRYAWAWHPFSEFVAFNTADVLPMAPALYTCYGERI